MNAPIAAPINSPIDPTRNSIPLHSPLIHLDKPIAGLIAPPEYDATEAPNIIPIPQPNAITSHPELLLYVFFKETPAFTEVPTATNTIVPSISQKNIKPNTLVSMFKISF